MESTTNTENITKNIQHNDVSDKKYGNNVTNLFNQVGGIINEYVPERGYVLDLFKDKHVTHLVRTIRENQPTSIFYNPEVGYIICPFLSKFTSLKKYSLVYETKVTMDDLFADKNFKDYSFIDATFKCNLKPLEVCTGLEVLELKKFKGDLNPLRSLRELHTLDLERFQGDLSPLSVLTNLHTLYLNRFKGDINPLSSLKNLRVLNLGNYNGVYSDSLDRIAGDLSALASCTELRELHIEEFLGDNINHLANLKNLYELELYFFEGDLSPLLECKNLHIFNGIERLDCSLEELKWIRDFK